MRYESILHLRWLRDILPPSFRSSDITGTNNSVRDPLPDWKRRTIAWLGLALLAPLAAAFLVRPNPTGLGTHQRFGLPPCSFLVIVGRPCPTCGMTTSWAHLVHGEWLQALHANSGGVLLCVLDAATAPWLLISAIRGRWFLWTPKASAGTWIMTLVSFVILVDWCRRLGFFAGS